METSKKKKSNGIWILEAKGTNKPGKGTMRESKQLPWHPDLPEQRLLKKSWSDGHKHRGGLFFQGGCIKLSCRLYMWDPCAFTDIFILGLEICFPQQSPKTHILAAPSPLPHPSPGLNSHHLIHLQFSSSLSAFTARESLATPELHLPLPFQGKQYRISGWKRDYDLQKANTLCPLPSEWRRLLLGG